MDNIDNTLYIIIIYDVSWFRSNLLKHNNKEDLNNYGILEKCSL